MKVNEININIVNFFKDNNVILLGDSVFKNNLYVTEKYSVENRLDRKMNTLGLAEDGAVINDIMQQYNQIPEE